ncbi:MAG: hypothetical protein HC869_15840 [Rhodospirillales bacterium]|nr:hypothetical protein [Rhodospirillales bacterium]
MRSKTNGGFAAGCNAGLRILTAAPRIDRFVLLNPDALIAEGALESVRRPPQ